MNNNLQWKIAGNAVGYDDSITIPDTAKELIITAYNGNIAVYQIYVITEQLSTGAGADVFYFPGYYYSENDYGYGAIYINKQSLRLKRFFYNGTEYKNACLRLRYR